jgi:hypothetical protein
VGYLDSKEAEMVEVVDPERNCGCGGLKNPVAMP